MRSHSDRSRWMLAEHVRTVCPCPQLRYGVGRLPANPMTRSLVEITRRVNATPSFLPHGVAASLAAHILVFGGYSLYVMVASWWPGIVLPEWSPPKSGVRSLAQTASRAIVLQVVLDQDSRKLERPTAVRIESSAEPEPAPSLEALETHLAKKPNFDIRPVRFLDIELSKSLPQPSTAPHPRQGCRGVQQQEDQGDQPVPTPLSSSLPKRKPAVTLQPITSVASVATRESVGAETEALPRKLYSPYPEYPAAELAARIGGRVRILVRLDQRGIVVNAKIVDSSGSHALDQAAVQAVRQYRFEPFSQQHATARLLIVPVRFEPPSPYQMKSTPP